MKTKKDRIDHIRKLYETNELVRAHYQKALKSFYFESFDQVLDLYRLSTIKDLDRIIRSLTERYKIQSSCFV